MRWSRIGTRGGSPRLEGAEGAEERAAGRVATAVAVGAAMVACAETVTRAAAAGAAAVRVG